MVVEPPYEFNHYNTETIQFVLDKTPPIVYGTPQVGLYGPSEFVKQFEYSISFTELLYCEMPYVFDVIITFSNENGVDDDQIFENGEGIHVMCAGNTIKYRFDAYALDNYESGHSFGSTDVKICLERVQDMARNQIVMEPISSQWDRSSSGGMSASVETWDGIPSDVSMQQWQVAAAASGAAGYVQCVSSNTLSLNGVGCDGKDNNCVGGVDECEEDIVPPKILFKRGACVDTHDEENDVAVINSPTFTSLSDARAYLESVVDPEDDCASDLRLDVSVPDETSCENTMLTVGASDNRCPSSAERQFKVKVDTQEPDVSIQFDRNGDHFVGEMPTDSAYLFIVSILLVK